MSVEDRWRKLAALAIVQCAGALTGCQGAVSVPAASGVALDITQQEHGTPSRPPSRSARSGLDVSKPAPLAQTSFALAKDQTYTMADLTALQARGSYEELLGHIEDIPPSARGADWDRMLVTSAKAYISQLSASSANYDAFWTTEALVQRYPSLRSSPDFMAKRAEIGKVAIDRCFKQSYVGQGCLDHAKDFIAVAPDRALDVAVGKIVRLNQNHYVAVPFFRAAVTGTTGGPVCADPDLKLAVMAGLGLPPEDDVAKQSCEVAVICYDTLRTDIRALRFATSTYSKANADSVLKTKGDTR